MRYTLLLLLLTINFYTSFSQEGKSSQYAAGAQYDSAIQFMQHADDLNGLKYLRAAITIYQNNGDRKGIANCYQAMGQIAINHSNPTHALKNYLAALKISEALGDKTVTAYCYNRIGDINKGQRNYKDALKYDLLALQIFKETNNKNGLGSCYNSIGDVFENEGHYDEALSNYTSALKIIQETGDQKSLTWPYYNIGEVYMLKGDYSQALKYYQLALKIQENLNDQSGKAWSYNNIAAVYIKRKQLDTAEKYCLQSLEITTKQNELSGMTNASRNLSDIYEQKGDHIKALQYYKAYKTLQDSVLNRDNTRNLVTQQMQYDFDKKEAQIKEQQDKKDLITTGIGALILLAALVVRMAYRSQRKASMLKSELLQQKEESIVQKEILMREIHHRVKNNLQVIGTLLELQLASITDSYARDAITESATRLKAISLIHQQLYRDAYLATVECSQFTTDLHTQVSTIFINSGQYVTLRNEMPPIMLDIDTAVPLGLILNELMTNSYKYAFKGSNGSIDLRIEKEGDSYMLKYKDSGPGLPDGMDLRSLKSLGILIMQSLTKQIGGAFTYSAETKTFLITFRDAADMKKDA
ncbi:hypothetical protein CJD36_004170 [Flavipsychrobacter stenotrophus]|uniref:Histidine kinase/HSP90-like ATPase domain-containing protein n=1 Tax=Flavipsychrobacter stenotrophus TaxID=2077091 RepID=A0A2S7T275_9BACT|nr:tetratricopeptide repeat protein [Flavipsychrobacter stenotrophus]PQJ12947.1 hypothetical protein CJD36_004170 [Flavipsychrobacter stenotrophus]